MDNLKQALIQKQEELQILIKKLKDVTADVPQGSLRISHCKSTTQYYHCTEEKTKKYIKYIQKKNQKLAYELAQKDYNLKMLEESEKNLSCIEKIMKNYCPEKLDTMYGNLNPERKKLVEPWLITDDEYVKIWKEKQYIGKAFTEGTAELFTEAGERVRSKSEKIIADMLNRREIPYKYEAPLHLNGIGTIYPDFTILNRQTHREIYLEHLGMMDNAEYCENALYRIDAYQKNGITLGNGLFITYETAKSPLNITIVDGILKSFI